MVLDAATSEAIKATIMIIDREAKDIRIFKSSKKNGDFNISLKRNLIYTLYFYCDGFEVYTETINTTPIHKNKELNKNIFLERDTRFEA